MMWLYEVRIVGFNKILQSHPLTVSLHIVFAYKKRSSLPLLVETTEATDMVHKEKENEVENKVVWPSLLIIAVSLPSECSY